MAGGAVVAGAARPRRVRQLRGGAGRPRPAEHAAHVRDGHPRSRPHRRRIARLRGGPIRAGLTGATGHLGSRLLPLLVADPSIDVVQSVARRPLPVSDPKLRHVCADLRSRDAVAALAGVDVLWHLAFQLWRSPEMAAVNRAATDAVLAAAPARIVFASSAAVYGAWPENPLPLLESHPARPNDECAY